MNTKYAFLWVGCFSLLMNTSCFKQLDEVEQTPPIQLDVEQNMAGKWGIVTQDAKPVASNDKQVITYVAGWSSTRSNSNPALSINWMSKTPFSCTVYGNKITEKVGAMEYNTSVITISPTEMQADVTCKDGNNSSTHRYVFRKIDQDYAQGIIGLWEEKFEVAGLPDETDHRWEFRADGTFVYYNRDVENAAWVVNPDMSANYVVDGNWLAMMRNDSKLGEVRECWDLTLEPNQMYWIALRNDSVGGKFNEQKQLMRIR